MKRILISLELYNGTLKTVHKEILSFFSRLKEQTEIKIIIFTSSLSEKVEEEMKKYYLGDIEVYEHQNFNGMHSSVEVLDLKREILRFEPSLIVLEDTIQSLDISPILAEWFSAEMFSGVSEAMIEDDTILFEKEVFDSTIKQNIRWKDEKLLITVKNNAFIQEVEMKSKNIFENIFHRHKLDDSQATIELIGVEKLKKKNIPINEAKVIVAGGSAVKDDRDMQFIYDLADALNAGVAGSRKLVDSGIIRRSMQIGQSGKIVSPRLIFALGISGQQQFTAGYKNAKTVVAVNKEKDATIFQYADFCIIGDIYEFIPTFIEMLLKENNAKVC